MSPHPPAEDNIGVAAAQALDYAEQALLGGLLLAPEQLVHTASLLPEHFYRPVHSALFAAMRHLSASQHLILGEHRTKEEFAWVRDTVALATKQAIGLTPSYAHTLISTCPTAQHVPAYTRMVLAGHTRRTLAEHAQRVAQAATDRSHPDPVGATCIQIDQLAVAVEDLARHWRPHPGFLPRTTAHVPESVPAMEERLDDEQMLLAKATAHPEALSHLRGYLQPEDFASALHAGIFACLTGLAHRDEVIDPVTVLWESQHRRLLIPAGPYTPEQVLQICQQAAAGDADYWAVRVLGSSLLQTAFHQGQYIKTLAEDTSLTPHQLITGTRRSLSDFATIRNRWNRAQHAAASPAPKLPQGRPRSDAPKASSRQPPRPRNAQVSSAQPIWRANGAAQAGTRGSMTN
ncbi:DnaB-like helicase N-terminal domain-containing protein [Streptomyces sp. NPDC001739]